MCGIVGWIDFSKDLRPYTSVIEGMRDTLANRGPDAAGLWESEHALIAHRRLTVVDPAGGAQPMVRTRENNNYVLSYNGELYNTAELRSELQSIGYRFQSSSDTEVLLVSYIHWGPACVDHLNGIYAFAVWNEKEQSLFMARDRFGVKPLFYAVSGDTFIFASEIKAILANPLIRPEVDTEGLAELFSLGPSRTPGAGIYRNIHEVKPACYLIYDRTRLRTGQYWKLQSHPHEDALDTTIEKVRSLVTDSIERQFVSDVPVCTFLSGGLDSSAITALAANYFRKEKGLPLHTYSIDYKENNKYFKASSFQPDADAPWVQRMAEEFDTQHHNITIDTPEMVEALQDAVLARDMPGMADIDSSLLLFCREVKKDATVALSGECSDEVFGGYPWFHREEMLHAGTFPWSRNLQERTSVLSDALKDAIRPEAYVARRYSETLQDVPRLPGEKGLEERRREIAYLNLTWFMTTLLDRKDRMSMGTGLEVRVPFCDHRLVQYVWNIPWEMKYLQNREKGLLRAALAGILPEDVLWRRKSPYPKTHNPSYEKAVSMWMQEILHDSASPLLPLINKTAVETLCTSQGSDYGRPWFGQLMAAPQMLAYLIQTDIWLRHYKIHIV